MKLISEKRNLECLLFIFVGRGGNFIAIDNKLRELSTKFIGWIFAGTSFAKTSFVRILLSYVLIPLKQLICELAFVPLLCIAIVESGMQIEIRRRWKWEYRERKKEVGKRGIEGEIRKSCRQIPLEQFLLFCFNKNFWWLSYKLLIFQPPVDCAHEIFLRFKSKRCFHVFLFLFFILFILLHFET